MGNWSFFSNIFCKMLNKSSKRVIFSGFGTPSSELLNYYSSRKWVLEYSSMALIGTDNQRVVLLGNFQWHRQYFVYFNCVKVSESSLYWQNDVTFAAFIISKLQLSYILVKKTRIFHNFQSVETSSFFVQVNILWILFRLMLQNCF